MNEYATLTQVRNYLSLASQNTSDDAQIITFIQAASDEIRKHTKRYFHPKLEVLRFDLPEDSDLLRFRNRDVLAIKGLSDTNGASEISSEVWWLENGENLNDSPYDRLVISQSSGSSFKFSGTPQRAIVASAITGYHEDYNNAWVNTGLTLGASMLVSLSLYPGYVSQTITLNTTSAGSNTAGITPRIDIGMTIKIEEEYFHVQSAVSSSQVQVIRAINGTTQGAHGSNLPIYSWAPDSDINYCATRLAAWQYQQGQSPFTTQIRVAGLGAIEVPETWPRDVKNKLNRFIKRRVDKVF